MRILIIEDQRDVRKLLAGFLDPFGTIQFAEDGIQGIACVLNSLEEGERFDVLFLDIMMPKMDGQEVLQKIRELEEARQIYPPEALKIIMTTALDDRENVISAFRNQADAYLIKPILKDNLFESLAKAGVELGD